MSFEQFEGDVANAYRYRGVPVRFTYRVDIGREHVGSMDIDTLLPGHTQETRLHTLNGPWGTREEALEAAKEWAAGRLDQILAQA